MTRVVSDRHLDRWKQLYEEVREMSLSELKSKLGPEEHPIHNFSRKQIERWVVLKAMLESGYIPAIRCLCEVFERKSPAPVQQFLYRLRDIKMIDWEDSRSRTIHLTFPPSYVREIEQLREEVQRWKAIALEYENQLSAYRGISKDIRAMHSQELK
jgi:hypothetical protein